ncbi:MAG: protein kinase, partial [Candidatus Latescibacteria bacterium]|nr:protein kinase [Candidatus Latescibacterota bacterium]
MSEQPGKRVAHYELLAVIGRGGMGTVYRAWDTRLGREVAVKVLAASLAAQEEYVKRFFREAQIVARLTHPNVVKIYDVGQEEDVCFLAMELLDGRPLNEVIPAPGGLPLLDVIEIALQVANALDFAHQQGVLHRDIKPSNIMIMADGTAKILDFGLARLTGVSVLTLTGNVIGTIDYIAPEQVLNEPVDHRADLYSFGVVIYEMLTGRPPFIGEEVISVIYQHINDDPLPPSMYNPAVPVEVDGLVLTLLAKRSGDRYQSAAALMAELARCHDWVLTGRPAAIQQRPIDREPLVDLVRWSLPQPRDEFQSHLIGRTVELERLHTGVRRALDGDGQLMLIAGSAGIGKTRLVTELMEHATAEGMWPLFGRCLYQEMAIPYQPFVEAFSRCLSATFPDPYTTIRTKLRARVLSDAPNLAELMPHIWTAQEHRRLSERTSVSLSPEAEKQRLFQSILQILLTLTEERGIILCIDDLQWGDSGSVQLLHYLARQLTGRRLYLVATYRPEDLGGADQIPEVPLAETLRRLNREGVGERLVLGTLPPPEVRTLVEEVVGSRAVPVWVWERVARETGGNPLFVLELLKWWRDAGLLGGPDQEWTRLEQAGEALPPRVYDLIAHRLSRLRDTEREVLEVAAIGGERFDVDGLAAALGSGRIDVLRHLHRLERRHGIISPVEGGVYQFAHGKTQEVLYRELPAALRQAYHAAWG